ncbi:hypothetical protein ACQ4PT_030415 [Festuca glaucescens]
MQRTHHSGLVVNFAKSFATPIRCDDATALAAAPVLSCHVRELPLPYLGLPLSLRKPTRAELQLVLDKLANKLAFWKARLMSRDGRVAYVSAVMAAFVVYQLMALDVEPWFIQAVDKLCRGFLWAGKNEVNGGNCMVAWDAVCAPKCLGGLGLANLRWMHAALRARWMWLQRTDTSRPWSGMRFAVCPNAAAMFRASVVITVEGGESILFWEDPWIGGLSVAAVAPAVLKLVKPGVVSQRKVSNGLANNSWVRDISGTLSVDAVVQFLKLWTAVESVPRGAEPDVLAWKWMADSKSSSKSAYRAFFHGTTALPGATLVWHSFAPFKFRFHAWLWLRWTCWTTDRRLRRGLPSHVVCPLCNGTDESADHIAMHCPFSRSIWEGFFRRAGLAIQVPATDSIFHCWWPDVVSSLSRGLSGTSGSSMTKPRRPLRSSS